MVVSGFRVLGALETVITQGFQGAVRVEEGPPSSDSDNTPLKGSRPREILGGLLSASQGVKPCLEPPFLIPLMVYVSLLPSGLETNSLGSAMTLTERPVARSTCLSLGVYGSGALIHEVSGRGRFAPPVYRRVPEAPPQIPPVSPDSLAGLCSVSSRTERLLRSRLFLCSSLVCHCHASGKSQRGCQAGQV